MPSTYSPNLRIELIASGEQANTWGVTTNNNLGTLIEQAIAGLSDVDVTASDVTLTALNGYTDQSRNMMITISGSPGVARSVFCPDGDTKVYVVANNADDVVTFSTVSGLGVDIPVGTSKFLFCDGTDVYEAVTAIDTLLLGGAPTTSLEAANKGYVDAAIAGLSVTANRAVVSNGSGNLAASATTSTEIGYVSGVTSAIQTQLNNKPSLTGSGASGTWGINISGNSATATAPASGGSFITSSNIGSQSVNYANSAGSASNITSYTINQNVGTGNAPTFAGLQINGSINATGNVTAYGPSDRNLKESIEPIAAPLEKIAQLSGVTFDWTDAYLAANGGEDGFFLRKHDVGLIAQEVRQVIPEAVAEKPDGYLGIQYTKVIPLLVECIKELSAKVEALESRDDA